MLRIVVCAGLLASERKRPPGSRRSSGRALACRRRRDVPLQEVDVDMADSQASLQRRVLAIVLVLNLGLAVALGIMGWIASSSGLIANAVDNGSDAAVYAISVLAVGRSVRWKRAAAIGSGVLLLVFAGGVIADTVRRAVSGSEPIGKTMIVMAVVAAVVNLVCLWLLRRLKTDDVNLRAAKTFSVNDFVSNGGVLVAGLLVAWFGRNWPDLVVGFAVAAIAVKGAVEILRDVTRSREEAPESRS